MTGRPKVIQGVKPDTKPTLPNSHSWGLFCNRIQDPLLLSGGWVEGKRLGGKLGPFWMAVGRNGAGRRKGVPTTLNPPYSVGRAVSNYPGGREEGFAFLGVRTLAFSTSGQR